MSKKEIIPAALLAFWVGGWVGFIVGLERQERRDVQMIVNSGRAKYVTNDNGKVDWRWCWQWRETNGLWRIEDEPMPTERALHVGMRSNVVCVTLGTNSWMLNRTAVEVGEALGPVMANEARRVGVITNEDGIVYEVWMPVTNLVHFGFTNTPYRFRVQRSKDWPK